MKRVLIPLAHQTEELECISISDILTRAGIEVTFASIESEILIHCARGAKIQADAFLSNISDPDYDLIALPGGNGAKALGQSILLTEILTTQLSRNKAVAAICAAPAVVLAHHGMLEGKKATCYPTHKEALQESYLEQEVVIDQNIITSQGPATAIPFALAIIEYLLGTEVKDATAKGLLYS